MEDLVTRIQRETRERIELLRPLATEYAQLLRANTRLERSMSNGASKGPRRGRGGPQATSAGRAPQGSNRARILAAIGAHPGIDSRELAESTGIPKPSVHQVLRGLKADRAITAERDGRRSLFRLANA